jgi:hypothetical protein
VMGCSKPSGCADLVPALARTTRVSEAFLSTRTSFVSRPDPLSEPTNSLVLTGTKLAHWPACVEDGGREARVGHDAQATKVVLPESDAWRVALGPSKDGSSQRKDDSN